MEILIDTNIFIHREDSKIVPEPLRRLEKSLNEDGHNILIHPLSETEIRNDSDNERRRKNASRIETYATLGFPSYPSDDDTEFRQHVSEAESSNDLVDNALLYAVYSDLADFLITEDQGIHKKAIDLGVDERVFTIKQALEYFGPEEATLSAPISIKRTKLAQIDLQDQIFDSLKKEYPDFRDWAMRHPDRTTWVNYNQDGSIGAILILKPNEVDEVGADPSLDRRRRMKISTLKVAQGSWGSKIGELFISIAIREAIHHELNEVYLTHYVEPEDYFVEIIRSYGFRRVSSTDTGEGVFLKRLIPGPNQNPSRLEMSREFYPSFYDGNAVQKFLIPVRPEYHNKLFSTYSKRNRTLNEFKGEFNAEGNAIKKAYLTGAKNHQAEPGDVLIFYRSIDEKEVTSIGVCESAIYNIQTADEIRKEVGKRSVFTGSELEKHADGGTNILLFRWHFDFESPLPYNKLLDNDVLTGPLRAMKRISEKDYRYIKTEGGLDERFAFD